MNIQKILNLVPQGSALVDSRELGREWGEGISASQFPHFSKAEGAHRLYLYNPLALTRREKGKFPDRNVLPGYDPTLKTSQKQPFLVRVEKS